MLHCSLLWTSCLRFLTKSPAIPQQLYKTALRSLSAIAELLVFYVWIRVMVIEYCKLIQIFKHLDPVLIVMSSCIGYLPSVIVIRLFIFLVYYNVGKNNKWLQKITQAGCALYFVHSVYMHINRRHASSWAGTRRHCAAVMLFLSTDFSLRILFSGVTLDKLRYGSSLSFQYSF